MRTARLVAALLLVGSLAVAGGAGAGRAGAAQASGTQAPGPRLATADEPPSTLRIAIADIKPLAPVATSTLVVTGTVANPGPAPVFALSVALTNVGHAQSRQTLHDFEADPNTGSTVLSTQPFPKGLAGGASTPFTLKVPTVGQFLDDPMLNDLVYELTVSATGELTRGGPASTLGVAGLTMNYFPSEVDAPLRTGFVIPVTAVPDQGPYSLAASQQPSRELLTDLTAPNGRLDKLLSVAMAARPAGGIPGTKLTLALDPALIERVCALAGKCRQHPPAGTGAAASQLANSWLAKLTNAVNSPDVTVVGLPYADADIGAMSAAGDTAAVERLLSEAGGKVGADLPTASTTTDLQPLLPVDGLADATLATTAKQAGSTVAVLSDSEFRPAVPAPTGPPTVTASTSLSTAAGNLAVLVTDPTLQNLLLADNPALSTRLQEQQLLTELALITSEAPNYNQSRTVVLEAPRDWDVPLAFSTHLVDALGAVNYVSTESLGTLQGAIPVPRERAAVAPRPASAPLPASSITTIDSARSAVAALHSVAVAKTETISPPFGEALDRMLSAWWRGPHAGQGAALLTSITNDLTSTVEKVSVSGGGHGVLLTGPSGTLPVQVRNFLGEKIAVVVHVKSAGLEQLTGRDFPLELDPGTAPHQVGLQITTRSTHGVAVTVQLLAQTDLSQVVAVSKPIAVRSTSVGKVAVGITAAALTLLVLLIVFRAGRRIAAKRRGEPAA